VYPRNNLVLRTPCFSASYPQGVRVPPVKNHCLRGNIADGAMQMDIHTTLYPFYTREKMPHVTVTITKTLRWQQ